MDFQNIQFYCNDMNDKPIWRKIEKNCAKPTPRWGHTCCVIKDQILFFGGYADSNYMNDLWTYDLNTQKWQQVITTGDKPSQRSNCSMNYDPNTNSIVIFGGGGPNKQRFNEVNHLDWNTKVWTAYKPKTDSSSPWQRTYHIAQLKFPYLLVFGGQGLTDMDDLWMFNFTTQDWTEIKTKDGVKPGARRFHSSCLLGNELYVIAGCYSKYRCLGDIYSMDLTPLIETGKINELKWQQRAFEGKSYLPRWGHSSVAYDGKIYVFAGRFSNDLNDLLMIDVKNSSIKMVKCGGNITDTPKSRRRHCAGFVGSCMIVFGGFNGEYFNDLHYINLLDLNQKMKMNIPQQNIMGYLNRGELTDARIQSSEGRAIEYHSAVIARYFQEHEDYINFLEKIDGRLSYEEIMSILKDFYAGFTSNIKLANNIDIPLPQSINRKYLVNTFIKNKQNNSIASAVGNTDMVISLDRIQFQNFMIGKRNHWSNDGNIITTQGEIMVNVNMLIMQSQFFKYYFLSDFKIEPLKLNTSPIITEIVLNYLQIGSVVVPGDLSVQSWEQLGKLANYLCLTDLVRIVEGQMMKKARQNCNKMEQFAVELKLQSLLTYCVHYQIMQNIENKKQNKQISLAQKEMRNKLRFLLAHREAKEISPQISKKRSENQNTIEEKQNNRQCSNV